jgi:hypothetical protein
VADFVKKVSSPSGDPDPFFMEWLQNEVPLLFRPGWDRGYADQCLSTTLNTASCSENSGVEGGSRMWGLLHEHGEDVARREFVESVLSSPRYSLGGVPSRVVAVSTAGKWRVLSVPPFDMNRLRPLHKTMYNHLSSMEWLQRGDAKPSSFKKFCVVDGEVFVSGDYESATDNLNIHVQREILRLVLQSARHVPNGIMADAMKSFSLELVYGPRAHPVRGHFQQSGQMMGHLLSFPLLCLTNYLTFRWLTMDPSIPVKINGDDIVFRCRPSVADRWMEGVGASGLVLSRGKTLVDCRYFTLNSCLFKAKGRGCSRIPFLRSRALFGMEDSESPVGTLAGRFQSFAPGFFGRRRTLLRGVFLRENRGWINQSCRSLRRGLGIPVTARDLKESGLWVRELEYLSFGSENQMIPQFSVWSHTPEGFEIAWVNGSEKKRLGSDEALRVAFIDAAWKPPKPVTLSQFKETFLTGPKLGTIATSRSGRWLTKVGRLLKVHYPVVKACLDSKRGVRSWCLARGSDTVCASQVSPALWDGYLEKWERKYCHYVPIRRDRYLVSPTSTLTVKNDKSIVLPIDGDLKDKNEMADDGSLHTVRPPPCLDANACVRSSPSPSRVFPLGSDALRFIRTSFARV